MCHNTKVCSRKTLLKYPGLSLNCRQSTQHSLTLAEELPLNEVQQRAQQHSTQALVSDETRAHKKYTSALGEHGREICIHLQSYSIACLYLYTYLTLL